jgi:hypothetical protein
VGCLSDQLQPRQQQQHLHDAQQFDEYTREYETGVDQEQSLL